MSWEDYDYVTCGCCGAWIADTPEENADHETRGHDLGYGECVQCAEWGFQLTMRPIFAKVREALGEENRAKWDGMGDGQKAAVVEKMLDEGILSWKVG